MSDVDIHRCASGGIVSSNINNYEKSASIIAYFCNKYEKRCCNYNRLKYLFILADRYHIRKYGNTISNSRMYEYNYFLTMLKKHIEKQKEFILIDGILNSNLQISELVFSDIEKESLNFVFDYFKKYNNSQLQRYMKENVGLIKYCSQFFTNIRDEYCQVSQSLLEQNINRYDQLCDRLDTINDGKSIRNEK